jgi:imidazolonepropionase-like amidohydrolase
MLADQAIVVRGDRIVDIQSWNSEIVDSVDPDVEVLDLADATLLPGLIDAHVHLVLDANWFSADGPLSTSLAESSEALLLRAVGNAQAALKVGVTTVCDLGAPNELIFALRKALENGVLQGPRVVASGSVITTPGGHGHQLGRVAQGAESLRQAVAEQAEAGADLIKIMLTGGGGKGPGSSQYGLEELCVATAEAKRLGQRVAVHCHGIQGIRNAVAAGVDRIEHCTFVEDGVPGFDAVTAEAIVQKGIYVCPTNVVDYRQMQILGDSDKVKRLAPRAQLNTTWRQLVTTGAQIIAGSDAGISQIYCDDYVLIMELMVQELGMSPMKAILAGTKVAAEALGLAEEIGTLEVGKRADMIAVSGNPLKEITALRQVRLVMAGGEIVLM